MSKPRDTGEINPVLICLLIVSMIRLAVMFVWNMTVLGYRRLINAMHPWIIGVVLLAIFFVIFVPAFLLNAQGIPIIWQVLNTLFMGNAQEGAIVFLTTGIIVTFLGFYYPKK